MHNVAFPDMVLTSSKLQVHHNRKRSHLYEYLQQVGQCGYGIDGKMQYYAITYQWSCDAGYFACGHSFLRISVVERYDLCICRLYKRVLVKDFVVVDRKPI